MALQSERLGLLFAEEALDEQVAVFAVGHGPSLELP
jgi:hypothetical protein